MPNQEIANVQQQSGSDAVSGENMVARIGLLLTGLMLVGTENLALASLTLIGILPTNRILVHA